MLDLSSPFKMNFQAILTFPFLVGPLTDWGFFFYLLQRTATNKEWGWRQETDKIICLA